MSSSQNFGGECLAVDTGMTGPQSISLLNIIIIPVTPTGYRLSRLPTPFQFVLYKLISHHSCNALIQLSHTNPTHFHRPILDFPAMPIHQIAVGGYEEFRHPGALKAAGAEFFSTLIFVFAGQGSGVAFSKLTDGGATTPSGLVAAALAHAFGLFVAVSVGANISGGHVNPAVTFGAFVGGNLTLVRGILYIIAQLLGSTVACLLLSFVTGGSVSFT